MSKKANETKWTVLRNPIRCKRYGLGHRAASYSCVILAIAGMLVALQVPVCIGQGIIPPGYTNGSGTNFYMPPPPPTVFNYPTNATLKWCLQINGIPGVLSLAPLGTNEMLYCAGNYAYSINTDLVNTNDPNYPEATDFVNWQIVAEAQGYPYPLVVGPQGRLIGNIAVNPCAINATNGQIAWSAVFENGSPFGAGIAVANDGTVYLTRSQIWAITNDWPYANPESITATNAITNYFSAVTPSGNVSIVLTNCGVKWWSAPNNDGFDYGGEPVVGADGTIYANGENGVYAVNPTNGAAKWSAPYPFPSDGSYNFFLWPAIGPDGTIYYAEDGTFHHTGSYVHCLFAINPNSAIENGVMPYKWVFTNVVSTSVGIMGTPSVGPDGTVYEYMVVAGPQGGGYTNLLVALNPDTGLPKWIDTNTYSWCEDSSGIAVGADGEIYSCPDDNNGTVYSLSPSGTTNWLYETGDTYLTAPLIGPDGTLFFGDLYQDRIWAFATPASLACSEWPEPGKNARRTGVVAPAFLTSPLWTTNGFQFTDNGISNTPVCNCATYDFKYWTNVGEVELNSGTARFTDTQSTNWPYYRFYKAYPQ